MKYEKPVVTPLAFAADAIHNSTNKAFATPSDSQQHATSTAYEADE
jgi:hypothetical protein